ncbi:MAG: hypothetical protein ACKV19_27375 [Verrucomicrobiales bacterium]
MRRTTTLMTGVAAAALPGWTIVASEPVLTHVHPAAVERGATTEVKLVGKFDPWPCHIWSTVPGLSFSPGESAGTGSLQVPADAPAGPCLIRAFNAEGASAPIAVVIADQPQTLEVEPNDDFRAPQVLTGPVAIVNGRHEKAGDVDSFAIRARKGEVLVARVEAHVLAAGYDALLQVRDEAGRTLAFNHDHVTMDPFLACTAPEDGTYIVQTMGHAYPASTEIRFAGGETCVYRLHLSTGPVVRHTWPLAATRGQPAHLRLEGWNLTEREVKIDRAECETPVPVVLSENPESVESAVGKPLPIPSAVSGRLSAPGEVDRYGVRLTKDSVVEISVTGRGQGSEIDPWVKVFDFTGKELATNDDDGGSLEARLLWTAPADGDYEVAVGDVAQRGGHEVYYRLALAPPAPSVQATITAHTIKLDAGKSAEVKVNIALRHGFKPILKLIAVDLPAGVSAAQVDVPETGGEVTLMLTADPAAVAGGTPMRLRLREVEGDREHTVVYRMATTSENNGVPQGYQQLLINETDQAWLTVGVAKP